MRKMFKTLQSDAYLIYYGAIIFQIFILLQLIIINIHTRNIELITYK